ncbi:NAD-dependent epimerase/dehydratase family protein [Breznakia pachnodae]|uniref:Nucleoside-diphosphate-sugar epimerase n=1 Tax=Breznakia pachnodae TaxID=265178 RepID=A0ABU0E3L5_9FIRM|nr:NAD-dependent epimerase/dehydratase family protein [Breznakia pachnodae]MDQ0361479.1 nucleoside-diphosphate-sugar epimerase [Breznakia pachnodae]
MRKVLLVGGKGNISFPIARMLAKDKDVELYLIERTDTDDDLGDHVHRLAADVFNEKNKVKQWIEDISFDCVVNFVIMNKEAAENSVELFANKTKQFIFISTVCVLNHQISCNVDETMEKGNAYYQYGKNKEECEKYFLEQYEKGFPLTIVRPTQTYSGPRIPLSTKGKSCWSVISRMMKGKEVIIHGDGQSVWASTHADDFAPLFYPLIGNPETIGEVYHVMNPESMTWDMIYQELADLLNVEYKPVYISEYLLDHSETYSWKQSIHGDKHFSNIFDISKAKRFCPDYTPKIDIRTGLQMYLDFMESHPEMKVEDPQFDEWSDKVIEKYKKLTEEFVQDI